MRHGQEALADGFQARALAGVPLDASLLRMQSAVGRMRSQHGSAEGGARGEASSQVPRACHPLP